MLVQRTPFRATSTNQRGFNAQNPKQAQGRILQCTPSDAVFFGTFSLLIITKTLILMGVRERVQRVCESGCRSIVGREACPPSSIWFDIR